MAIMTDYQTIEQIKRQFPDEWILLGNPEMEETSVLGGIVVYHSKNKKDLLNGRDLLTPFELSTWVFTGDIVRDRKLWLGIYRKAN